ncbi:tyrosine-type recombinase/integrase [bacterium]|nr:tyrosine-type recombinase/integrase [bacterium]
MPRQVVVPRYTLHKPSGQGRARYQGRDLYFGPYEAPESHERYARFVAELAISASPNARETLSGPSLSNPDLSVSELILRYLRFAQEYYGNSSKEPVSLRGALKPLHELYGSSRARLFGPLALKAVLQHLVKQGLCRTEINRRLSRIKRAFKWAVSEELIPPGVLQSLQAVSGLRRGRSAVRESDPVKPVAIADVQRTLPFLTPQVATICQLQLLTGMRPSEVVAMRLCDLDRRGFLWVYTPVSHKTQHLGMTKQVLLGPQSQALLQPFLQRSAEDYLFTPLEAEAWRNEQRAQHRNPQRRTKIYPCELVARGRRQAASRARTRERPFQPHYTEDAYRRAITYALKKARKQGIEIPHWFPYQLRHTHGTEVRRKYGLEAAQVMLGHATADVTQIYAERNMQLAAQVASEMG